MARGLIWSHNLSHCLCVYTHTLYDVYIYCIIGIYIYISLCIYFTYYQTCRMHVQTCIYVWRLIHMHRYEHGYACKLMHIHSTYSTNDRQTYIHTFYKCLYIYMQIIQCLSLSIVDSTNNFFETTWVHLEESQVTFQGITQTETVLTLHDCKHWWPRFGVTISWKTLQRQERLCCVLFHDTGTLAPHEPLT